MQTVSRPAVRRLLLAAASLALTAGTLSVAGLGTAADVEPRPTPQASCQGKKDLPETDIQGRVPLADYVSGRAAQGYRCNAAQIAHHGTSGGFKVERYTDRQGRTCAYYDSTLLFPRDVLFNAVEGLGVIALDMTDPRNPVQTATLTSPAMLSPHESLLVNKKRGILAAVLGNPGHQPRHRRPLRRRHRLPLARAALLDPLGRLRPRERLRPRRPDLLGGRHHGRQPHRRRHQRPARAGAGLRADRRPLPRAAALPGRSHDVRRGDGRVGGSHEHRRPAGARRLPGPGPQARPRTSRSSPT